MPERGDPCPRCEGKGEVQMYGLGGDEKCVGTCPECGGTGKYGTLDPSSADLFNLSTVAIHGTSPGCYFCRDGGDPEKPLIIHGICRSCALALIKRISKKAEEVRERDFVIVRIRDLIEGRDDG